MDPAEQAAGRVFEGLVFDLFQPIAEPLEDREIPVDHGVEKQGAEVVGPELAKPRAAVADPLADAGKAIGHGAVVERDHVAVAEKDGHRIGHDRIALEPGHPHGDQHLVAEDLDLGPFVGRGRVFEGQFADLKDVAD